MKNAAADAAAVASAGLTRVLTGVRIVFGFPLAFAKQLHFLNIFLY